MIVTSKDMLRVENLTKTFREQSALEEISFSIKAGEVVGIIGRSGAGKTTLLRCLNGSETPDSGHVFVEGKDLKDLKEGDLLAVRRRIGLVFQHFNLLESRTVSGNISLSLEISGIPRSERAVRIQELVKLVGLAGHERKYPAQLSGGQKQRVGIARALAAKPAVLLCDEATSALDPEATSSVLALLRTINRELGVTIVFITHEMDVIRRLAHRILVLDQGQIVEDVPVEDLARGEVRHALTRSFIKEKQTSLPEWISPFMTDAQKSDSRLVVVLKVKAGQGSSFLIADLCRQFGTSPNIVQANIGESGPGGYDRLVLILPQNSADIMKWLEKSVYEMKVLGYVSSVF